jgi:hypothetical protein
MNRLSAERTQVTGRVQLAGTASRVRPTPFRRVRSDEVPLIGADDNVIRFQKRLSLLPVLATFDGV